MIEQPADYKFDEIKLNEIKKFKVKINESTVSDFAKISGDYNPLHMDDNYAQNTSFKKRVCHGMLLASFFSRLIGMYLPGKNALYFSQTLDFQNPCFLNDEVTIEGQVIAKSQSTRLITVKTAIYNQDNKCLVEGIAKVILREE